MKKRPKSLLVENNIFMDVFHHQKNMINLTGLINQSTTLTKYETSPATPPQGYVTPGYEVTSPAYMPSQESPLEGQETPMVSKSIPKQQETTDSGSSGS